MEKREKLSQIRRTAAEVLAAAVSDYNFKVFIVKGGETPWGFYFDFIFINPFSKEMLPLIEERMRKISADNIEIKAHEMIPSNAAEFMRHNKCPYPAHFVETCGDPLVQVLQIGTFVDHVHGSHLKKTGELKAFKLLKLEKRPPLYFKGEKKEVHRITGVADESKDELKAFIKKYKGWIDVDHLKVGEKLDLFQIDLSRNEDHLEIARIYWKKKGEELLHKFYTFWRNIHLEEDFELVVTDSLQITGAHKKLYRLSNRSSTKGPVRFAEFRFPELNGGFSPILGLLGSKVCHKDYSHIFCLKNDLMSSLNSSLKSLNQTTKMLGLKHLIEVSSPNEFKEVFKELNLKTKIHEGREARIEWKLYDDYERSFKGPFLTLQKRENIFTIKRSLFPSVERLIALILDSQEKDLSQKKELLGKMASCDE